MAGPELFRAPIPAETVRRLAEESFGDMVKFVVDLRRRLICAGGGLHSDEEALLLENGSRQEDLWGANYFPDLPPGDRLQYTSMINIRPLQSNKTQEIADEGIRQQVAELASHYFESKA